MTDLAIQLEAERRAVPLLKALGGLATDDVKRTLVTHQRAIVAAGVETSRRLAAVLDESGATVDRAKLDDVARRFAEVEGRPIEPDVLRRLALAAGRGSR